MMKVRLRDSRSLMKALRGLKPHDHICLIYETSKDWKDAVIPFLKIGLERGEKCLYVVDSHTANQIHHFLKKEGIDVESVRQSGQLVILHENEAYTRDGSFDPDRMIALLVSETEKALSEGYTALRVTGEMTWVLNGLPGSEKVIEYEAKLNSILFPKYPCVAICQYNRQRFNPEIIKGVILTHPIVIWGKQLYENIYYIPPEEVLSDQYAERQVEHWLNTLERERRTRRNREFLANVIDRSSQPMSLKSPDGRLLLFNKAFLTLLGYEKSELAKLRWNKHLTPPEWLPGELELLEELHRKGKPIRCEKEYLRKDGSRVPVELLLELTQDDEGKPLYLAFITDISERKQTEEELKKYRDHLEELVKERTEKLQRVEMLSSSVLASLRDHVVVIDTNGQIVAVNDAWRRFAVENGDPEAASVSLGANYLEVCRQAARGEDLTAGEALHGIESVLTGSRNVFSMEYECSSPFEKRWFVLNALPLKSPGGGAVICHTDVTQRKKAEEDLQQLQEELRRVTRIATMGELTAAIAHELNQPLTGILSNAEAAQILLSAPNPDLTELKEILSDIIEDDQRASKVISKLRSLFKKDVLKFEPLDLNAVIQDLAPMIRSYALLKGVVFVTELDPENLPVVGDRIQLQQVILNLAFNGFEAMEPSAIKALRIRTGCTDGKWVTVRVEDSGPGINPKKKEEIFKPFFTTKKDGMGIGLAVSHSIIRLHQGRIWIENSPDRGATVSFTLPLANERL